MSNKKVVKKVWNDYWNELNVSKRDFNLSGYRKILLNELREELNNRDGYVNITREIVASRGFRVVFEGKQGKAHA